MEHVSLDDATCARDALASGEVRHAAHHVAGLIAADARSKTTLELVRALDRATDDVDFVVPVSQGMFAGSAALRAWLLQSRGALDDACALVIEAHAALPSMRVLGWLDHWLDSSACGKLDPDRFASALNGVLPSAARGVLDAELESVAERVLTEHQDSNLLFYAIFRLIRDSGRLDDASEFGMARHRDRPSWQSALACASVEYRRHAVERSIQWLETAVALDPTNVGVRNDLGDQCLQLDRIDEALAWYEHAVELAPNDPWAAPSALFLRTLFRGDDDARSKLVALASDSSAGSRARELASRASRFEFALPPRQDAIVKVTAHARERGLTSTKSACSSLEAPSALLAVRLVVPTLQVEWPIPDPDPRDPRGDVPFVLWRYATSGLFGIFRRRTNDAVPGVPPPRIEVQDAIASLASTRFSPDGWWRRARATAESVGADRVADIVATMVHPPSVPTDWAPWEWVFHVQVAAAYTIARLDERWPEGPRRSALFAIARGPVDWTCTAALAALTEIAIRDPNARADATEFLLQDIRNPPEMTPVYFQCIAQPLVSLCRRLPELPDDMRQRVRALGLEYAREDL